MDQAEFALVHIGQDDGCDQVAADDKEDVHADESATHDPKIGVKKNNWYNRDGP